MKKVSVVVTTKNEAKNIENCLASVARQDYPEVEVLVIDNKSSDETKALAAKFTEGVYDHGPERSAQRNFGAQKASGDYILYLDADMILAPNVISTCVDMFAKDARLRGLYVPEKIVGNGFWIKVRRFERSFYDGTVIDAVRFLPRDVFLSIGGFDESMSGPEDWDFDKKVRSQGKVAVAQCELYHNEGDFDFDTYLGKKGYYAQSFHKYVNKWGAEDPDLKKQLGFFYRFFGVFIERGKFFRLLSHPLLTCGMYYLRFRVGLSYLSNRKHA